LTGADLRALARERLKDARVLLAQRRYDGATYFCGFAVELAIKSCICKRFEWPHYKHTRPYQSFETHDLPLLIELSGAWPKVQKKSLAEWSTVRTWTGSDRYRPVGYATAKQAQDMIVATKTLLKIL